MKPSKSSICKLLAEKNFHPLEKGNPSVFIEEMRKHVLEKPISGEKTISDIAAFIQERISDIKRSNGQQADHNTREGVKQLEIKRNNTKIHPLHDGGCFKNPLFSTQKISHSDLISLSETRVLGS